MKKQKARFKARKKFQSRYNAQFKKLTTGYNPRPRGMGFLNKHRQNKG